MESSGKPAASSCDEDSEGLEPAESPPSSGAENERPSRISVNVISSVVSEPVPSSPGLKSAFRTSREPWSHDVTASVMSDTAQISSGVKTALRTPRTTEEAMKRASRKLSFNPSLFEHGSVASPSGSDLEDSPQRQQSRSATSSAGGSDVDERSVGGDLDATPRRRTSRTLSTLSTECARPSPLPLECRRGSRADSSSSGHNIPSVMDYYHRLSRREHVSRTVVLGTSETPNALRESVANLDGKRVEELVRAGVSVNTAFKTERGYVTLLHTLCCIPLAGPPKKAKETANMATGIVALLLEALANVNPRSSSGLTPIMCACMQKNVDLVRLLIRRSADVSSIDDSGYDTLLWSIVLDADSPQGRDRVAAAGTEGEDTPAQSMPSAKKTLQASAELVRTVLQTRELRAKQVELEADPSPCWGFRGKRHEKWKTYESLKSFTTENGVKVEPIVDKLIVPDSHGKLGLSFQTNSKVEMKLAYTPIELAVRHLNSNATRVLLDYGLAATPDDLTRAVLMNSPMLVKTFLDTRVDPNAACDNGLSPMDVALSEVRDDAIMELLREKAGGGLVKSASLQTCASSADTSSPNTRRSGRRRSISSLMDARERRHSLSKILNIDHSNVSCFTWLSQQAARLGTIVASRSRWLYDKRDFQAILFICVIVGLIAPDLWTVLEIDDKKELDVLIIICLILFSFEFLLQVIGHRAAYLLTVFCFLDIIGTASLIFDLSVYQNSAERQEEVGNKAVFLRAARAMKLGARAGRITRLVKLLRFLPGFSNSGEKEVSTAQGLTQVLVHKLSMRAAILIILLVVVLPLVSEITQPEQDWSMRTWTEYLADAMSEGAPQYEVDDLLDDIRAFFSSRTFKPYGLLCTVTGTVSNASESMCTGRIQYLEGSRRLRAEDERMVSSGDVTMLFDFRLANRVDAGINLLMIIFTICVMAFFALMISGATSRIAVRPLEAILNKVRVIGSTLYLNVEQMQMKLAKNTASTGDGVAARKSNDEMALLDCVVRKLAILSEITVKKEKHAADQEALDFLGARQVTGSDLRRVHGTQASTRSQSVLHCDQSMLGQCTAWDFDVRSLETAGRISVCSAVLEYAAGKLPGMKNSPWINFVEESAAGYLGGPSYHNFAHAADVTQVLFIFQRECSRFGSIFSALEEVALLSAAVCHDVGHPGLGNDFLVQTSHELAIRYNDKSPLENMSCARLFEISKKQGIELFSDLSKDQYNEFRSICIEAILHTDNVHHVSMVKNLQMFAEVHSSAIDLAEEGVWPSDELSREMWEHENRTMLRNFLLHMSDISNPCRPFAICKAWALCIVEEFFAQGDMERQLELPLGPLNDREKVVLQASQVGFIEFFVFPLVLAGTRVLTPLEDLTDMLICNTWEWVSEWVNETNPSGDEKQTIEARIRRLEERSIKQRKLRIGSPRFSSLLNQKSEGSVSRRPSDKPT
eukprot:TRINITY_DN3337_c0_g3_i1.p1 TRINITY_DN3337_c0_g3~~TRINITY_DN3337_c0_g3_i1.p1  ORF type:complete len:1444 (+),score=193.61 TRINITY_DN3337_c0_g3_i1:34-4365(+)